MEGRSGCSTISPRCVRRLPRKRRRRFFMRRRQPCAWTTTVFWGRRCLRKSRRRTIRRMERSSTITSAAMRERLRCRFRMRRAMCCGTFRARRSRRSTGRCCRSRSGGFPSRRFSRPGRASIVSSGTSRKADRAPDWATTTPMMPSACRQGRAWRRESTRCA